MKSQMNLAIVALTLTLGISLLFPIVASAAEGQQCPADPVNMFIAYGADVICSIDQTGNSDFFRFDGTAGERIKLEVLGSAYPCMELVGFKTACTGAHQNWIDIVLPTTQEYTVRVYDYYLSTGTFNLFLEREVPYNPDARQTTYGQNLTDGFPLSGDLDEFIFTASVNDVVDLLVTSTSIYPCFTLFAPDGNTTTLCSGAHSNELRTQPLTLAGTYMIFLYDYYNSVGAYRVVLECISGPCFVTTIPDVSGFVSLRGAPLASVGVSLTQPGAPGPQLTTTDINGYYQFLHIISGQQFNVFIHASTNQAASVSEDAASADKVEDRR